MNNKPKVSYQTIWSLYTVALVQLRKKLEMALYIQNNNSYGI